jgi:hypothetical protein
MDSIDHLLEQIKAEYEKPKLKPQPSQPQQPPQLNLATSFTNLTPKPESFIDNLLSEVKEDFVAKDAEEELKRQQAIEQERVRQEQLKAKQIEALKTRAQEWLTKLDPFSPEGLWFERFAEGYASKLEAAIEYLQTNA